MNVIRAALLLACVLFARHAGAHESWVEPANFRIDPGGRLPVRVCVADGFEGWSLARDPWRIAEFIAVGPGGATLVVGLEGADPAGIVRLTERGDYVIVYRSHPTPLEVPPSEFDAFLREKGLDTVLRTQGRSRAAGERVRESYMRHSKALVRVGEAQSRPVDRQVGLALELVAEPGRAGDPDAWTFRLFHRGRPLAGALVVATRLGSASGELKSRSAGDGRARFALREPGLWRVAAVHLVPAPPRSSADWQSLWASLAFELLPRDAAKAPRRLEADEACRNRLPPAALSAGAMR